MRKGKGHGAHEEEHENHEAWVIPYADMITLLMGLFIVMWSIGNADLEKLREISTSFASSLGMGAGSVSGPADGGGQGVLHGIERPSFDLDRLLGDLPSITPERLGDAVEALEREEEAAEARQEEHDQLRQVEQAISAHAATTGVEAVIGFRYEERGLVVSIVSDEVLFEPGSADLRPEGRRVLDGLADALLGLPNQVAIEGHTDSVPIATPRFPSNWELSTARATSVLQYFIQQYHFPPDRLTASGYAEQRPIGDNATAEGRAKNRRVDIAVLSMGPTGGSQP